MPITVGGSVPRIQVPAYVRGRRNAQLIDPDGVVCHVTVADGRTGRSAHETLAVLRALRSEPVLLAA
jgi:alkyl hydroperoxide reductase subunit AhpC